MSGRVWGTLPATLPLAAVVLYAVWALGRRALGRIRGGRR